MVAICLCVQGQTTQSKDAEPETKGLPPRAAPSDYQARTRAGAVTVAAEFAGHSVPTLEGPLSTEEYVVVEVGLYGPPGTRIKLSADDFALRINGKKTPFPSQRFALVLASLKDPEWVPPEQATSKSRASVSGGGTGQQSESDTPPAPVPIPIGVQRAMAQRVERASLPEGERTLPEAGLLFFQYRGKAKGIHSVELIYAGPAGKATLPLQP
jgi:hypothetical protein